MSLTPEQIENMTLTEAKQYLRANWQKGCLCPACGQIVKLYPYTLNKNACVSLIYIYQLASKSPDGWVHVQDEFKKVYGATATAMSYILLKHWGFIVPKPGNDDPTKNANGYWTITEAGKRFVRGQSTVPKTAMVYKNSARQFKGVQVNIKEALTNEFNYQELMGEFYDNIDPNIRLF